MIIPSGLDDCSVGDKGDCTLKVFHNSTKLDDQKRLCTNGGRVVTVSVVAPSLSLARNLALANAVKITFKGASIRKDIGLQAVMA